MENYEENIKLIKHKDGTITLNMPKHYLTRMINAMFDGKHRQEEAGYNYTAEDTGAFVMALYKKEEQAGL